MKYELTIRSDVAKELTDALAQKAITPEQAARLIKACSGKFDKMPAIKVLREVFGFSVLEAKEFVETHVKAEAEPPKKLGYKNLSDFLNKVSITFDARHLPETAYKALPKKYLDGSLEFWHCAVTNTFNCRPKSIEYWTAYYDWNLGFWVDARGNFLT